MATRQISADLAARHLRKLCVDIENRCVGSPGNRAATDFFASAVAECGFETEQPQFDCMHWTQQGATLAAGDESFEVHVSPYSLGCSVNAPLAVATTVEELDALVAAEVAEAAKVAEPAEVAETTKVAEVADTAETAEVSDIVLLLRGDIASEQLMPKNFVFYNPDEHKRIIGLLEALRPRAIVAATTIDPGLAGAVSPFPLLEDGDFDVPSVFTTAEEGLRLAAHAGEIVNLQSVAHRSPAIGCNVVARKGDMARRVVLFAHIDAKDGTPGAIDNGTGVVILLLVAQLLADYDGDLGIEIVALNGEDYYAASGEMQYLAANEGRFPEIALGINMDGVGYREGQSAFSLYGCPDDLAATVHEVFAPHSELSEGEPWYQSDHGLFIMHQRPALALTSEQFTKLWTEIAHTADDTQEIVDPQKLVDVAHALHDLLLRLADR